MGLLGATKNVCRNLLRIITSAYVDPLRNIKAVIVILSYEDCNGWIIKDCILGFFRDYPFKDSQLSIRGSNKDCIRETFKDYQGF